MTSPRLPPSKLLGRRDVLRIAAASAGVAATGSRVALAAPSADIDTDKEKARYRETEHVKTFYRVNRY